MITGFDGTLPLFVHRTFGWDSVGAGLIFLCVCLTSFCEPLFGRLSDKYGAKWPGVICFVGALPPYLALRFVQDNTHGDKILLGSLLFCIGSCISLGMTPLTAEISTIVHEMQQEKPGVFGSRGAMAQAFGLTNCAFAIGSLIGWSTFAVLQISLYSQLQGPVWAGFMVEAVGWGNMTLSIGVLSIVSAIPIVMSLHTKCDSMLTLSVLLLWRSYPEGCWQG